MNTSPTPIPTPRTASPIRQGSTIRASPNPPFRTRCSRTPYWTVTCYRCCLQTAIAKKVGAVSPSVWLRPERAAVGRPARRSRTEITEAAVTVADRDGAEAVSMRRVAAELETGAGTLYRYVETRDELLDLMVDHVTGEYDFAPPTADWLAELVDLGVQARGIHRRHPWLADRILTAPGTGPHGADVIEHYLAVLAHHPADDSTKLVAFGVLNALVATFARAEHAQIDLERNTEYLAHVAAAGTHPHISALNAPPADNQVDHLPDVLRGALTGLLPPMRRRDRARTPTNSDHT